MLAGCTIKQTDTLTYRKHFHSLGITEIALGVDTLCEKVIWPKVNNSLQLAPAHKVQHAP